MSAPSVATEAGGKAKIAASTKRQSVCTRVGHKRARDDEHEQTCDDERESQHDLHERAKHIDASIDTVANYWEMRKQELVPRAGEAFISFVDPAFLYGISPIIEPDAFNIMFTEWLLFEYRCFEERTPFEEYLAHPPADATPEILSHVQQIVNTQLFSRFAIRDKDTRHGIAVLEDVQTARRYDVYDPALCERDRWRNGTIGERIACVEGLWLPIAPIRLYDRAPPADTAYDGPGFFHPEDRSRKPEAEHASFYLRLIRDTIGIDGRYRHTTSIPPVDEGGAYLGKGSERW